MNNSQLVELILDNYSTLKQRNQRYSKRAFAAKLGISSGAMSEIFSGKRKISSSKAKSIMEKLNVHPGQQAKILSDPQSSSWRKNLEMAEYEILQDWVHFAILSLIKTTDFKNDAQWMAQRLEVSSQRISKCLQRLVQLGFIESKGSALKRTIKPFETSENIKKIAIQAYHAESLDRAKDKLSSIAVDQRDFSAMTFAASSDDLVWIQKKVRKFQDEVFKRTEKKQKDQVYQISVQLFPLTSICKWVFCLTVNRISCSQDT